MSAKTWALCIASMVVLVGAMFLSLGWWATTHPRTEGFDTNRGAPAATSGAIAE